MVIPAITEESLRSFPKVLLHDHLDGGLRPETIIEIADRTNYLHLPSYEAKELEAWMLATADQGKLELYLEAFTHTIAVMQNKESLFRVAEECVHDLNDDGVMYAEVRFAPELFEEKGLTLNEVITAVLQGFESGMCDGEIIVKGILCAMRSSDRSTEIAEAAISFMDKGIVGFDIAGPEIDFPPRLHRQAFDVAHRNSLPITVHAGEAAGPGYIEEALTICHASRIGHGTSVREKISNNDEVTVTDGVATELVDRGIALEVCPTSNIHTGIVNSIQSHPVNTFLDAGLTVTINTDNRLMSSTSLTNEFLQCSNAFNWTWEEITSITLNAVENAFLTQVERDKLVKRLDSWKKDNGMSNERSKWTKSS